MRKKVLVLWLCIVAVGIVFAVGVMAAEEKKITGTVVAGNPDPAGTMAPVMLQCEDGVYLVLQNAVSKRMEKAVGSQADVTGLVDEADGRKVITPWLFERLGGKKRIQPTG